MGHRWAGKTARRASHSWYFRLCVLVIPTILWTQGNALTYYNSHNVQVQPTCNHICYMWTSIMTYQTDNHYDHGERWMSVLMIQLKISAEHSTTCSTTYHFCTWTEIPPCCRGFLYLSHICTHCVLMWQHCGRGAAKTENTHIIKHQSSS